MILRNCDAPLGAEITGIDLAQPVDRATFHRIENAFHDRGVLIFRDQHLTEDQQIAFSRRFGNLEIHPATPYLKPGHPEILVVSNVVENGQNIGLQDAGQYWHSDLSFIPTPSRCSLLYALEVPTQNGEPRGDTLFLSAIHAYDTLPHETQQRIANLRAVHSYGARYRIQQAQGTRVALTEAELEKLPQATHPVVRPHPITGRKTLFVNEGFCNSIEGEENSLLQSLFAHLTRPEMIYRHKWRPGDLLMWDNASTQHRAVADYSLPLRRLLHRTTVSGAGSRAGEPVS